MGNLVEIGHVNVNIPDQQAATDFYISALGLTRDPYMMTGTGNMWVNAGRHQFHLPTGTAGQRLRGSVGLVVPDLAALRERLTASGVAYAESGGAIEVMSPWGNRLRLHAPAERFGPIVLGLAYVECDVAPGSAEPIAAFYREIIGADVTLNDGNRTATVHAGTQALVYRETATPLPPYDGHHIQVYIADHETPRRKLIERKLIAGENNPRQYRFTDIVGLDDGRVHYTLEHEVRSLTHPMYGRTLVNRDPSNDVAHYVPEREVLTWQSA